MNATPLDKIIERCIALPKTMCVVDDNGTVMDSVREEDIAAARAELSALRERASAAEARAERAEARVAEDERLFEVAGALEAALRARCAELERERADWVPTATRIEALPPPHVAMADNATLRARVSVLEKALREAVEDLHAAGFTQAATRHRSALAGATTDATLASFEQAFRDAERCNAERVTYTPVSKAKRDAMLNDASGTTTGGGDGLGNR